MKKYQKKQIDFKLYMITDSSMFTRKQFENILTEAVLSGVKAIQLREKYLSARSLFSLAKKVNGICDEGKTSLLINDRVDIALAVGAEGVHLTTKSLSVAKTREIVGEKLLVGASAHSLEEVKSAEENGSDFVLFGPVFETESKKKYGPPQGLKKLETVTQKSNLPVFAVGGIDSCNASYCLDFGAQGVAVISAIQKSHNIPKTFDDFRKSLGTL